MGDPTWRRNQTRDRLRAQIRKKRESLADQFDFKIYIAFVFKDKKKKSALFEVAEVVPVMTNNYEDNILKGVQASSYSLQSSMELLQKDVVQLHAPRYQSMRRVSQEPGVLPLGKPTKTMCVHTHTQLGFPPCC
ncbi:unnamed protein product [Oncorhynchus mykiss]|uniref:Uncharacterized protein n=1 Tax=Oncorhynchus mykiss TaxID=8022 RepID=A0A060YR71_ONCMY|nr:unnamed protein product [Oncorhynchus mykiss]